MGLLAYYTVCFAAVISARGLGLDPGARLRIDARSAALATALASAVILLALAVQPLRLALTPPTLVFFLFINPVLEELLWRTVVQELLEEPIGRLGAAVAASALFAAYHLAYPYTTPILVLHVFTGSLVFIAIPYAYTHSLPLAVTVHAAVDAASFIMRGVRIEAYVPPAILAAYALIEALALYAATQKPRQR